MRLAGLGRGAGAGIPAALLFYFLFFIVISPLFWLPMWLCDRGPGVFFPLTPDSSFLELRVLGSVESF